jgi:AraC-like DNA-binding protein
MDVMQPVVAYPEYSGQDEHGWYRQITTWACDGIHLTEDYCEFEPFPWHGGLNEQCGIGLVRRGAYRRRSRGVEALVDPNVGFLRFTNEEVEQSQFARGVREVTFVTIDPELANGLLDEPVAEFAFTVTPEIELNHHRLLAGQRQGADDLTMQELALDLVTRAAAQRCENVRRYSRRTTARSRRDLVSDACQVLHVANQDISLIGLADAVGCSPFHLSRVFGEITGMTIPQYRRQLRVHEAVVHIAAGATDLAAIAATVGFADHSHMTRSIVAQFGTTPSRLRELLREPVGAMSLRAATPD